MEVREDEHRDHLGNASVACGVPAAFTVDASVLVNAVRSREPGHATSARLLEALGAIFCPLMEPTLLVPELSAALARAGTDPAAAAALVARTTRMPGLQFVVLDAAEADRAARLAAELRLRGADAVYLAVALRYGAALVSLDVQQLQRASAAVTVLTPEEALARLAG